jgi:hypothetical protein
MLYGGIVARGYVGRAQGGRLVPEVAKLQLLVAHDTGVRCTPGLILIGKVIDYQPLEGHGFIDYVMGHSQRMGHATGIRDRLGAAALVLRAGHAILRPELHGDADDLPSLLLQQIGSNAGVHSSAHSNDDASGFG